MKKTFRNCALALGVGLALLWLASLGNTRLDWLPWLELAAALAAFAVAGTISPGVKQRTRTGAALGLAAGLFVLWYIALSAQAEPWIVWWNFSLGCLSLLLGVTAGRKEEYRPPIATPADTTIRHPVGAAYPYEWGPGLGPEQRPETGVPTIENPELPINPRDAVA
jgi:hypothetical protein